MASVKVAVRVRPLNKREMEMNSNFIINMEGQTTYVTNVKLPTSLSGDTPHPLGRERVKNFTYDYSYNSALDLKHPDYVSQDKVYTDLGQEVVEAAFEGYNACVFAYGQTGSGKTYTMMGNPDDEGIIPKICSNLFENMQDGVTTYRTEVSYLEIYNERVRDLLREPVSCKGSPIKTMINLKVREHPKDGPYVQDLSKHIVVNYNEIETLMNKGNANRTTAATNMNDMSSRSHAIFTIMFTQAKFQDDIPSEVQSKINLVDLAGSERVDGSGATGQRLKEGGSINKSLVCLGKIISTLADLSDKIPGARKNTFIPYRDSVLTWLLKDSLGGNAKTIMIATVSPADCNYAETLSTLRYAHRAKRIINKPTINEDPNVKLIRELREENARLRALLCQQGQDIIEPDVTQEQINRNEEKVKLLTEKWTGKWQETASILEEHKTLALRKEGSGVVLDSELPYLLALDEDILSTGMRLYHLREGQTKVGRDDATVQQDIVLSGQYIEMEHCEFQHFNGEVTLVIIDGALCSVNNSRVHDTTKINQGDIIRIGRNHVFRFNHPIEAAKLREQARMWNILNESATCSFEIERKSETDELEKLEERRRQIAQLEEEHCLAEARRLAVLLESEQVQQQLEEKEKQITRMRDDASLMKTQAEKAAKDIKRLSSNVEEQLQQHLEEQLKLHSEKERLLEEQSRLKSERQEAEEEKKKLEEQREKEQSWISQEKGRQLEEWAELNKEKRELAIQREKEAEMMKKQQLIDKEVNYIVNLVKERLEKMRDAEKDIYSQAVIEMRKIIEKEVKEIKRLSGMTLSSSQEEELDRELGLSRTSPDTSPSPERQRRRPPYEGRRSNERSRLSQGNSPKKMPSSSSQERIVRMRSRRKGSQESIRNRRRSRELTRESWHGSQESLNNGLSTSQLGSRESSVDSFGWHTGSGGHSMDDIKGAMGSRDSSLGNLVGAQGQSSFDDLKSRLAALEDKHDADVTLKNFSSPEGSFRSSQSEETLQDISQSIMPQESFDLSDDFPLNVGQMTFSQSDSRDSFVLDASEIAELVLDDKILSECSSIPPMDESRDDFMEQSGSDVSAKMTTSDLGSDFDSRKLSESECSAASDKEPFSGGPAIPERYLVGSPVGAKASDLLLSIAGLDDSIMSLCSEAEETGGQLYLSMEEISAMLNQLSVQVNQIHLKVCEALQRKYTSILSSDDMTAGLGSVVLMQFATIKPVFEELEKVARQATHVDNAKNDLPEKLESYDRTLTTVDQFIRIHEAIQVIVAGIKKKDFLEVLRHLEGVHELLRNVEIDGVLEEKVYKVLQTEACIQREQLLFQVGETWNEMLKWTIPHESRRNANQPRTTSLEIRDTLFNKELMQKTVQTMLEVKMLPTRVKVLVERIMANMVEAITKDSNTLVQVISDNDRGVLCVIQYPQPPAADKAKQLVPANVLFPKLEKLFLFIHKPFDDIIIREPIPGLPEKTNSRLLTQFVGNSLCEQLFEYVYKECLSHAVPQDSAIKWDKYNEVIGMTERFQDMLVSLNFVPEGHSGLIDYFNNVNSLFANMKSQGLMKEANESMLQELGHAVEVSTEHPLGRRGSGASCKGEVITDSLFIFVTTAREEMGAGPLKIPTCLISASVQKLVCLAYRALREAVQGSQDVAMHMSYAVANIFELFCDVVPSYHKKKLYTLTRLAALHHNNCMFIAHHVQTMDRKFKKKVGQVTDGPPLRCASMVELVPKIRKLGNDNFTTHIVQRKQDLLECLATCRGFDCVADDEGSMAREGIRRVIDNLTLTSAIYKEVLPYKVYCKAIGTLLNTAVSEICESVLSIGEFSADDCDCLDSVLESLAHFAPDLFNLGDQSKSSPEVLLHEFVPNWMKFRELQGVLKSGLQEVSDRWADGKGPLAVYFTPDEVRKLVMAIFENTSKRDIVLSGLK